MGSQGIVALVIGIAVIFFVPALVWATVIAGLVQIVQEKVRETRSAPPKLARGMPVASRPELRR
jgi:Na+-transporting methylmalonyl-CoA/oxaloacetate decarboxylase gamma subunit